MLPTKFNEITKHGLLPKMVQAGIDHLGVKEIPGVKNSPVIMNMASEIGVSKIYKNDDTSWCALFQNYICKISGKPMVNPGKDIYNLLRARAFSDWGNKVEKGEEQLGDILVFARPGGGHVGMYIAESKTTFFVLGGNQSNAVTISEIAKNRLVACRRYYSVGPPDSARKYFMDSSGKLSTNEA